ncbi:aldo-keto reductase family 1 member A1-B-like [Phymastichus coffea]|uniref:aldo-keto reductase family 1 member A1-B-like n=1 Tax=Phymastichus coffea TaxID=108790 RepID=UPI00273BCCA5|nr:aldo-keto reductase family 1 member A1-B-like [Phymastichus coffea]
MRTFAALLCLLLSAPSDAVEMEKLSLSSGHEMPVVGLGTGAINRADEVDRAITSALGIGYRHIDTAFSYGNEAAIGQAVKRWLAQGGKRQDLFLTSKLPNQANRPDSVERYLNKSLADLGMDYVDMYLIHLPFGVKEGKDMTPMQQDGREILEDDVDHVAIWKEMEKQVKSGRAKSIGVSNFNEAQISKIYDSAQIKPSNLQVESHVYLQQPALQKFCKDKNIVMTAYAPLGSQNTRNYLHKGTAKELPPAAELPIVKRLAKKYNKSTSQILLRHSVQNGLVVIPKSINPTRQKDNISLFDFKLTDDEMKQLDSLDKGEQGRVYDFLAWYKDLDKNKQYPFGKI